MENDTTKKELRGSGFDCPAIGTVHPKGTKIKRNPNGTITLILPKKKTTPKKKGHSNQEQNRDDS